MFPLDNTEFVDTDGDGTGNNADTDDDGDGVLDGIDAFPLNASEWLDTDGDGIGNNADDDDDGDGIKDILDPSPLDVLETTDTDNDGLGNNVDPDDDNDGVIDGLDIFPYNAAEFEDTDGDGIGNNSDADDDNDGIADANDAFPKNSTEWLDTDGDGTGNNADNDDDGDNVIDSLDVFPLNVGESVDTDGDGIGNNSDADDDNDGFIDINDAFPLDLTEWLDSDGDTVGNNKDTDDDNDGVLDTLDAFPTNTLETLDSDNDGIGNNADNDDDGDGVLDIDDEYPLDPTEFVDSDNDGIGNSLDTDDDNDGVLDNVDLFPLNPNESRDEDNDGLGNNEDSDDDNDGVLDAEDAFPLDPVESIDTDGDGIGNVHDTDDDDDGILDYIDQLPLDPAEVSDHDGDGLGDNADPDDDGDGMSDEFEMTYGFDPLVADSADTDTDTDGATNVEEEIAGTNPLIDDYAPVISQPLTLQIDADHIYSQIQLSTLVDVANITVSDGHDGDNCCDLFALGFESGVKNVGSGSYPITWRAVDDAGNIAEIDQVLNVMPLVNFGHEQSVAEGSTARVYVYLSGEAPNYPLTIPIYISGSVDRFDYQLSTSNIVIASGTTGYIDIEINKDSQTEGDEKLIVAFKSGINAGVNEHQEITISESNLPPQIGVTIKQSDEVVSTIAKSAGEVEVSLFFVDANSEDTHIIEWSLPGYLGTNISANQHKLYFDPDIIELPVSAHNLISFSVKVTDSGDNELSQKEFVHIPVLDNLALLDSSDTDRDSITDDVEGYADDDLDGLPAFLDPSDVPYVQQLHVNAAEGKLVETEPGLFLKLGKYARLQFSDGAQLSQQEIDDTELIEEDDLTHQDAYFDFEIKNIQPFGRSVSVVIPLLTAIPENAVYRKYSDDHGWQNFVENSTNTISSSLSINGICPPPHSTLYTTGLTTGDDCLLLLMQDGGANDADGIANGTLDDPGGLAIISNKELTQAQDPQQSSSGSFSYVFLISFALVSFIRLYLHKVRLQ